MAFHKTTQGKQGPCLRQFRAYLDEELKNREEKLKRKACCYGEKNTIDPSD
jgi:hypothetical protein